MRARKKVTVSVLYSLLMSVAKNFPTRKRKNPVGVGNTCGQATFGVRCYSLRASKKQVVPSRVMSALNPDLYRLHAARRRRFHPRSKRLSVHHAHRGENTRNTHLPPFLPKPNKHHPPSQPTTRAGRSTPSTKPPTTPPGAPASKNAPPVSRAVTTPSTFIFSIDVLSGVTAGFLSERFF